MAKSPSTIESLLTDESFQRWLSHTASVAENNQWTEWLQSDLQHKEIYHEALELWQLARFKPTASPDVNKEWENLRYQLNLQSEKDASILDLFSRKTSYRWIFPVQKSWLRYGAVAAIFILIFLTWYSFPRMKHQDSRTFQTVSTEYGQRVNITLPEGTRVILNANSTLQYPSEWTEKTIRKFELHGEAFFIVSPLQNQLQHHFIVCTSDGKVQVVGTRFAVYERGQGTRVAVEDGCVEIYVATDDSRSRIDTSATSMCLKSGNLLHFQKGNRSLHPEPVNILVYTSWWSDQLVLDNSPFEDIVSRLKETYGVHIEVRDDTLLQRRLSGSIENSSLQIIIEALGKALQVPVHREGKIIIFGDGIESRNKVL